MHFDKTSTAQVAGLKSLFLVASLFFWHAEGDKVASNMFYQMAEDGLPMSRLVILMLDGLNVNKTIMQKLQERITNEYPYLKRSVDLCTCVIHTTLCFLKGSWEIHPAGFSFPFQVQRATIREDHIELHLSKDIEMHTFYQHTEVHWLSIGPAIKCIPEQWDAIPEFIKDMAQVARKPLKATTRSKRVPRLITDVKKAFWTMLSPYLKDSSPNSRILVQLFTWSMTVSVISCWITKRSPLS